MKKYNFTVFSPKFRNKELPEKLVLNKSYISFVGGLYKRLLKDGWERIDFLVTSASDILAIEKNPAGRYNFNQVKPMSKDLREKLKFGEYKIIKETKSRIIFKLEKLNK